MALRLIAEVQSVDFVGNNVVVDFVAKPLVGAVQRTSQSALAANVTASNFEAGVKNLIITNALNQYSQTLVADEILLRY